MKRTPLLAVPIALLLGAGVAVSPTNAAVSDAYYVSPDGSDGNSGTSADAPFETIQHALDTAERGSTIHLAKGVYEQDAVTRRGGVTVTGPAGAIVQGAGESRIFAVQHDDVTLNDFTIDGLHGSPDSADGYRNKLIYAMSTTPGDGIDRLTIRGMRLQNAGGECVRLRYLVTKAEVVDNTIRNCGVYDFVFDGGGKNGEGVYIGTAPEQQGENGAPDDRPDVSVDNWVHHNSFDTQGNECVDIKENATANLVARNDCTGQRDPESAGLDSRGDGNVFYANHSYDNVGAGIRFGGDDEQWGMDNDAYKNTITGNQAGGIKFQATPQGKVCGNTMSGNDGGNSVGEYGDQFDPVAAC